MKLSGWGHFPVHDVQIFAPRTEDTLLDRIKVGGLIARGNGRAYGDSAVSMKNTVEMRHFNRLIGFDSKTGQVVAQAGIMLADIINTFLPRGWFPPVTPGTKFVTLGGMIAADVHGKNHHKDGSFGNFIDWIDVMTNDGVVQHCSRQENLDLFNWTVGGMGLTGIILRAAFRLRAVATAWIKQTTVPTANLDESITLFEQSQASAYSVAWIDCLSKGRNLGRSLMVLGDHATLDDLTGTCRESPLAVGQKKSKLMAFHVPSGLMNGSIVRAFNAVYHWNGTRNRGTRLVGWDSFFYPLDAILGWNKIYGRKGFVQFQCVLPLDQSRPGLHALLEAISVTGAGSFLAVLKRLGSQERKFSFPMSGYTLALDFPVNDKTLGLMLRLDQIVLAHGGRFYLAKDSRMTAATLRLSDGRTDGFVQMREDACVRGVFISAQSERLDL